MSTWDIPTVSGGATTPSLIGNGNSNDWLSGVLGTVTNTANQVGGAYVNLATIDARVKQARDAQQQNYDNQINRAQSASFHLNSDYLIIGAGLLFAYFVLKG